MLVDFVPAPTRVNWAFCQPMSGPLTSLILLDSSQPVVELCSRPVAFGAVQPSDFKEPRPQDVASVIEQVRAEKVPAIFGSEVFPSKVLKQIASETGANYIDKLRDDAPPGKPGEKDHTYLGMMLYDMGIMLPALGGNADALRDIDPTVVSMKGS